MYFKMRKNAFIDGHGKVAKKVMEFSFENCVGTLDCELTFNAVFESAVTDKAS